MNAPQHYHPRQLHGLRPESCPASPWLSNVALSGAFLAFWRGKSAPAYLLGVGLLGASWCLSPAQELFTPRSLPPE